MNSIDAVEQAYKRILADQRAGIWITLEDLSRARARAAAVDARRASGEPQPLAGLTVAIKDNIDVAGLPTTAACPAYSYEPAHSASAVTALIDAGAVVVGKTNMDQFATGLVGTRSPYGICPNAFWPGLIAGGSSSGSAVAVAAGFVDFSLGTDTAGSGRVPAACNGIVGLKPSRGRIATDGVVPACYTFDCVSVFTRTVGDAALVASTLLERGTASVPPSSWRIGRVPLDDLDFDDDAIARANHGVAVETLARHYPLSNIDFAPFREAGALLYDGAFVAERYAAVGDFIADHHDRVDPTVASIIEQAAAIPAWRLFRDQARLDQLRRQVLDAWSDFDIMVVPSVPRVPTVDEVLASPIERNSMLGTYTNFVNLLDLCAITVPVDAGTASTPPTSLTFIAPSGNDELLLAFAAACPLVTAR